MWSDGRMYTDGRIYTVGRNNEQGATICSPFWEHNKPSPHKKKHAEQNAIHFEHEMFINVYCFKY